MLRKLLVITLLFSTVAVGYAQKKDRKKKKNKGNTEEVVADTAKIDYKAIGAPLPPLSITTRTGEKHTEKDFKKLQEHLSHDVQPYLRPLPGGNHYTGEKH